MDTSSTKKILGGKQRRPGRSSAYALLAGGFATKSEGQKTAMLFALITENTADEI